MARQKTRIARNSELSFLNHSKSITFRSDEQTKHNEKLVQAYVSKLTEKLDQVFLWQIMRFEKVSQGKPIVTLMTMRLADEAVTVLSA